MKILMISTLNLSKPNGGTAHFTSIAQGFRKYGHTVDAIIPDFGDDRAAHELASQSFDTITFSSNNFSRFLPLSKTSINSLAQLFQTLTFNMSSYDWVYVRSNILSCLIALALRFKGIKTIITEHNGWFSDELSMMGVPFIFKRLLNFVQVLDARLARQVRVVVPGIQEKLIDCGISKDKITIIGNGTNLDLFYPIDKETALTKIGLDPNYFYLGFIGDLELWQGVETAIEAMPIICQKYPNTRLLIIGEGRQLEPLKKKYSDRASLQFLGSVPYRESNLYINSFDIALLPKCGLSTIGFSPIKLYAYAAAGRAILASNIRGISELEAASFVVLHQPGNPQDLAQKAIKMMSDRDYLNKMGAAARHYAELHFSWELVAKKILDAMPEID